jgi:putative membrane protein
MEPDRISRRHAGLLAAAAAVLIWSGIAPRDRFTWLLEVFPAIVGGILLVTTYRRFRFTMLVYALIAVHAVILMIGGKYTYAEVPLFNWIRDAYGLARNHYDRVGHFAQGFVPAMIGRELLLRKTPLRQGGWLYTVVVGCCLGLSAAYELVEWWTALATGEAATAFLGTQGDPWDTQWDMFMALIGSNTALLTLSRVHDRQLREMAPD